MRRRLSLCDTQNKTKIFFFIEPGAARKMLDDEELIRRAADREGRRTRRRQIRERIDINNTHLDGMSSDDEIHQDRDTLNFKTQFGENRFFLGCDWSETKIKF